MEHAGPLHASDRRLDVAFGALTNTPGDAYLHCLGEQGLPGDMPAVLAERLPDARWIPSDEHALSYIDPADHLVVHQAWLEACHGPDRVGRATVRTTRAFGEDDGHPGRYDVVLMDLVGVPGIDAVVVTLTPALANDPVARGQARAPRGAASFRLRVNLDGIILGGTPSVESLLGHRLDALIGTHVGPLIHPDDLGPATGVWEDVLAHPDQSQTVRLRLQHADGTWHWFSDTAWNALNDPDEPGVLSEFHDIGALVEAEQALYASELGFRTLAESLPVGIAVLDPDGVVTFANHRLVTLLNEIGAAGPNLPGPAAAPAGPSYAAAWGDIVTPEFAEQVRDLLAPSEPSSDPMSRQIDVTGPDGRPVHLLIQAVTIWNQDGRSVIVGVLDVTGEVRINQEHERLVQVVDEVDDVVLVTTGDGQITYLNRSAHRYFGDEAVGHSVFDFARPELAEFMAGSIQPAIDTGEVWSGDIDLIDDQGNRHTMASTISPVTDPARGTKHVGVTMRDVTAKRAHERELSRLARQDSLTGLPNRFALMELLEASRHTGAATDDVALFFIDLDNLKIVNDGLGHSAGDLLLEAVADQLSEAAGDDVVARFGGDEFVVVTEGISAEELMERAADFLSAVERAEVPGVSTHVSASIGVAASPRHVLDAESLVRDADAAMYAAKRAGRSRSALFDTQLRAQVSQRFEVEAALRDSIEAGGLEVHFQPIIALDGGHTTGLEALCRWGQISPADFIPIAEESGLILPLGAQVFAHALHGAMQIRASAPHLANLRVGVNVSARELDQPNFAAQTLAVIAANDIPPEHVMIELTETALIHPRDEVDACLRELREAGVTLALDDFLSGYSSLNYLRRYPIDVLKLDITYTQAMVQDPETRVIVEAVVTMAHRLGLDVVAEGVETPDQLDLVRKMGITWAQGYLVGRPAPAADVIAAELGGGMLRSPG